MASQSAHFNLTKPASTDNYDLSVINNNTDIIDQQMYNNQQSAAKVMVGASANADGESGRVPIPHAGDEDKYLKANGTWDTPSGGGGGSSTLSGLTDVSVSSPTNGQVLKYNSTTLKWENADESGGSSRHYIGQLIPRVNAADSHITASTSNNDYAAWGAFDGTSPSNLASPGANTCWLPEANLTNQYIQYHFDAPRYFTKININCFSNYSADWVGDIKVEGSSDGSTWTNILESGTTYELTAELQTSTTVIINLDDADLWEYIRVTFVDKMSVAYQPSCFIDEIYVYGGCSGSSSSHTYSTTEHEVGTWIDGSTLYEKTIYYAGSITSNELIDNSITTSNTDYFVCTELSYVVNNSYRGSGFQIEVNLASNGVIIDKNNAPGFTMTDTYATIRYTKVSS